MLNKEVNYNAKTGDLIMLDDRVYYVHDSYPNYIYCEPVFNDIPNIEVSYQDLKDRQATFRNDIWQQDICKSYLRRCAEEIKENSEVPY